LSEGSISDTVFGTSDNLTQDVQRDVAGHKPGGVVADGADVRPLVGRSNLADGQGEVPLEERHRVPEEALPDMLLQRPAEGSHRGAHAAGPGHADQGQIPHAAGGGQDARQQHHVPRARRDLEGRGFRERDTERKRERDTERERETQREREREREGRGDGRAREGRERERERQTRCVKMEVKGERGRGREWEGEISGIERKRGVDRERGGERETETERQRKR